MREQSKKDKVLHYLLEHEEEGMTSWQAIHKFKATRMSDIIYRLRDDGYEILSIRVPHKQHVIYKIKKDTAETVPIN